MSSSPVGVAIITGGSSGIGLALSKHLIAKGWHVFDLDLQPPLDALPAESSTFIKTNAADWDQLAASFEKAYSKFKRLDFCSLNAGTDDRDDIFDSISKDPAKPPKKPNMLTFEVNLYAPYYGLKLAAHYMSLNPAPATQGGKVTITSSKAALTGDSVVPQYASSKYGVVGLVRAPREAASAVNIRLNCIMPGMVLTNMPPPFLKGKIPKSIVTPMSTILRAYDELNDFDGLAREGRAAWVGKGKCGESIECEGEETIPRYAVLDPSEGVVEADPEFFSAWMKHYKERNIRFAQENS